MMKVGVYKRKGDRIGTLGYFTSPVEFAQAVFMVTGIMILNYELFICACSDINSKQQTFTFLAEGWVEANNCDYSDWRGIYKGYEKEKENNI